ncbi:hypothetical protein KCU65_g5673, partial [Aureobasidium melanogenum]
MVTTRNGALKDRRVTRSMAAPASGSSGVVKRKTAQKPKKTALKKQIVTEPEPTLEDRDTTSHEGSAPPAARPTTRSMTINNEDSATAALSGPPTQTEGDLNTVPGRVTRQTASQNALPTWTTTNVAPVDDAQAHPMTSATRTTDSPRIRRVNARIMITPRGRFVRPEHLIARTRASLRRALEGDQEWPDLSHGQRRELVRLFAWMRSEPGRTHNDYFDLPIRHEDLTTRPMVDMSIIPRVRAWYESLKTGTNDEEEEAIIEED